MSFTKKRSLYVSNHFKEHLLHMEMSQKIKDVEFNQKVERVIDSLLKTKIAYTMSVIFSITACPDTPVVDNLDTTLRNTGEVCDFIELSIKNSLTSNCVFIPFKSINEYLMRYPLTIFIFAKYNFEGVDPDGSTMPICYHLMYLENLQTQVDTFKTIRQTNVKLRELFDRHQSRFLCHFDEQENKQYNVRVQEIIK